MAYRANDKSANNKSMADNDEMLSCFERKFTCCPNYRYLSVVLFIIIGSVFVVSLLNILPHLIIDNKNFQVASASIYPLQNSIVIDADLRLDFSKEVIDALENGIPLTIAVDVQVFRQRHWWFNVLIKESRQLFELRYHPLTDVHEVTNVATNERYSFSSRQDAMAVLGTIRGAYLLEHQVLNKNKAYFIQIRTLLDISYLPAALRQVAALSSSWRLESSWYPLMINHSSEKEQI